MIQQLIHDYRNHHKFSINPHGVGVVLLERKGLKEKRAYLFISWMENNFAHEKYFL